MAEVPVEPDRALRRIERIEVRLGGQVTQVSTRRFGFRFIRVVNGRLCSSRA